MIVKRRVRAEMPPSLKVKLEKNPKEPPKVQRNHPIDRQATLNLFKSPDGLRLVKKIAKRHVK